MSSSNFTFSANRKPFTHVKVQFGEKFYWVADYPIPMPYGATLMFLLNDQGSYLEDLDKLHTAIQNKERRETLVHFSHVVTGLVDMPFYRQNFKDYSTVEPEIMRTFLEDDNELCLADRIIADDGRIMNKYDQVGECLRLIQDRYAAFLDTMVKGQDQEKKKGQKKYSPAKQICRNVLQFDINDRTLRPHHRPDGSPISVHYELYSPEKGEPEIVEKVYFDRLSDFAYVELMKGLQKGSFPKRCQNCGRWFLQSPGPSYSYCDRTAPGETEKTCRDIGATKSFHEKVQSNEIWKIHQRAYKKYYARVLKKTMTKPEFEAWAREAERLRDEALQEYARTSDPGDRREIEAKLRTALNAL